MSGTETLCLSVRYIILQVQFDKAFFFQVKQTRCRRVTALHPAVTPINAACYSLLTVTHDTALYSLLKVLIQHGKIYWR